MSLTRRHFLAVSTAAAATCAPKQPPTLAPIDVRPDRVIRNVVGLRPFRPSGFRIETEKRDHKIVIHNYGHGGAGITLSWGAAQIAVEEALKTEPRDCAVIGCGVIGLSTACILQQQGFNVTIYAKALPPETTSNIAGGLWDPTGVYDQPELTPQFRDRMVASAKFAFNRYQSLVGPEYGVNWLPLYSLSNDQPRQAPTESPYSEIASLYPDARPLRRDEHPFDVRYAYRRYSMLIEPAIYLRALTRDFHSAGGKIVVRNFAELRDLFSLHEDLLVNCTGLGAKTLFEDGELTPVRGQLSFLVPDPGVNYMTIGPNDNYMFPRHDGILLGGTHERGNSDLEPGAATTERILSENRKLFSTMRRTA